MTRHQEYVRAQAIYDAQMPREAPEEIEACGLCHELLPVDDLTRCPQCDEMTCYLCQDSDQRGWCVACASEHRRLLALEEVAA